MVKKVLVTLGILIVLAGIVMLVLWQSRPLEVEAPTQGNTEPFVQGSANLNTPAIEVRTYQSSENGYQISYPAHYVISTSTVDAGVVTFPPHLSIASPEAERAGTNLIESAVLVGTSQDLATVQSCFTPKEGEDRLGSITVSDADFSIFTNTGAAAGNVYQVVRYRTAREKKCYEVTLLIHSGTIGNYPEGSVVEFDRSAVLERLKTIFYSFRFLK